MTAPVNPYRDIVAEDAEQERKAAQAAAFVASKRPDPERWAKVLDLSSKTGLPPDTVDNKFDDVSGLVQMKRAEYQRIVSDTPLVDQWMSNPDNATVARDERENLGKVERAVRAATKPQHGIFADFALSLTTSGAGGLLSGLGHSLQSVGDIGRAVEEKGGLAGEAVNFATRAVLGGAGGLLSAATDRRVSGAVRGAGEAVQQSYSPTVGTFRNVHNASDALHYLAYQAGQGAGSMAAIIVGALAGGPAGGLATGAVLNYGDVRSEVEENAPGASPLFTDLVASAINVPVAALDAITPGDLAAKLAMKGIAGSVVKEAAQHGFTRRVLTEMVKTGLEEGGTEALQEAIQDVGTRLATGQAVDPNELIPRVVDAFVGGAVGGGIFGTASEAPRIRQGQRAQAFFTALGDATKDSKLVKNLPAKMQEAVASLTKDGPVETAYMPLVPFQEYWQSQGADPAQIAREITGSDEAYDQAVATGADIAIPTARYAATIAPTDHNEFFSRELRFGPDQMNGREVEEALGAQVEANAKQQGAEAAQAQATDNVTEELTQRLVAAGQSEDVARTNAEVTASIFRVLGGNEGLTPEQMLERFGFGITREEAGTPPAPVAGPPQSLEEVAQRAIEARASTAERTAERAAMRNAGLAEAYQVAPDKRDAGLKNEAGEFVYARTGGGSLRDLSRVTTDGLVDELGRLYETNAQEVTGPAVVQDPDFHTSNTGGPVLVNTDASMRAGGRVAARKKTIARIEAELQRRGVEDVGDRLYRVMTGQDLADATSFSFEQPGKGRPSARILIDPRNGRTLSIQFFETADLSSYIHELGHSAVVMMEDLAKEPTASPQLLRDLATLREWAGLRPGEAWTGKAHERVADGFSTYMKEGKAPSAGLRSAFNRIRGWLTYIYSVFRRNNVTPTDEVRAVFDRLLATEEEIAAAEAEQNGPALDLAALGLTDKQQERMGAAIEAAHQAASDRLARETMEEYRRGQTQAWKEARAKEREDVARAINAEPASLAYAVLTTGKLPDGSEVDEAHKAAFFDENGKPLKLSKEALVSEYADRPEYADLLKRLPRPYVYAKEGGIHPDDAALTFGLSSGDELIQALLTTEKPLTRIERLTDQRMREKHGDMMLDGTLPEKAMEAVHNEKRAELLHLQLQYLLERRRATFKGLTRAIGGKMPSVAAVRDQAERTIGRMSSRQITPALYQRAEARAAKAAAEAWMNGDLETAIGEKQKELFAHELYRAATAGRERVETIREYAGKLSKTTTRQRIGKAGGDYLEQLDAILDRYEFRRVTLKTLAKRESLLKWAERQKAAGVELDIPESVLVEAQQKNYRDVPLDELNGVYDALRQISHQAAVKNQLLASARARNLEEARNEIVSTIAANYDISPEKITLPSRRRLAFKLKHGVARAAAEHTRLEFLFRALDGHKAGGVIWQYFFKPFVAAENAENEMRRKDAEAMRKIMSAYDKKERARWFTDTFYIPEGRTKEFEDSNFTKADILAVALNWGNQYNRDAMMRGHGWDTIQVEAILSRLDARDWKLVQDIWDHLNTYWPEVEKLAREITGLAPEKVEASPFRIRQQDGTVHELQGGYYPVAFDGDLSTRQAELDQKADVSEMFGGLSFRAMTRHGHDQARTNTGGRAVLLDLAVVGAHLNQVIHDLTHRRAIIDVSKLIKDKEIEAALEGAVGREMFQQLNPWLKGIAGDRPREASHGLTRYLRWARQGVTVVGLGLRVSSSVLQTLGYSISVDELGVKYAARGLRDAWGNPLGFMRQFRFAAERSVMMRDRMANYDRDVRDALRKQSKLGDLTGNGAAWYYFIGMMDMAVSLPTWLGAYRKAMDGALEDVEAGDEQAAIDYADSAVRMTQAAGGAKDLAGIQRGGELQHLFTMFYSSQVTILNQALQAKSRFAQDRNVWRLAASLTAILFAPALLEEYIRGRGPDDDDEWWKWALEKELFYPLQAVVGVRDLANALEQKIDTGRNNFSISPAARAGEAVVSGTFAAGKMVARLSGADVNVTRSDVRNAVEGSGYVTQLPTGQAWKTLEYLYDWSTGNVRPSNPVTGLWQALVTGKPKD